MATAPPSAQCLRLLRRRLLADFQVSSRSGNCSNRFEPDKIYSNHSQRLSIDATDWQSLDNVTAASSNLHILDTVQPYLPPPPPELSLPTSPPNLLLHPLWRARFPQQRCNVRSDSASQLLAQLI